MNGGRHRCGSGISRGGGTCVSGSRPDEVAGESADCRHPVRPNNAARAGVGLLGPLDRVRRDRHSGLTLVFHPGSHEPGQHPGGVGQFVAQPVAQSEVVGQRWRADRSLSAPGQGWATRPQRLQVDLRVGRRRGQVAVPQHLADIGESDSVGDHFGRQSVPEPMRAHRGSPPGRRPAAPDLLPRRVIAPAWVPGSVRNTAGSALRPGLGEIGDQRLTRRRPAEGVDRSDGPCRGSVTSPSSPVHVVQFQSGDLNRPQPQPSEEQHYRQVTYADRPVLRLQLSSRAWIVVLWQPRRDSGVVPACDRRYHPLNNVVVDPRTIQVAATTLAAQRLRPLVAPTLHRRASLYECTDL